MVSLAACAGVALIALGMVLTPGPNMIYLVSRTISQGRGAGLVSLGGVAAGFGCYLAATVAGLSALFLHVPLAYDVVKVAGACYLAYLAWTMLRPGGRSAFEVQAVERHSRARLFAMGWFTNLLNPKIALMYAALLPQFVDRSAGPAWGQLLQLGLVQIAIALTVNGLIVLGAARLSGWLKRRPRAMQVQRWVSGTVLGGFAVHLALSQSPAKA
ncbi:LysE family translocator [Luteipulveratus halotolerans]|uniref:Lysine transporter LysE n=1 Tax=Luteipulveratus halotolerans TaxID=1631356 RepID=A0A0L6CF92_9MICO|nr:LysE family translocator [Luteipulveratus halotolerans]KNX36374.1 lysine transporter LysE [Luteipulveratus halotolerans]